MPARGLRLFGRPVGDTQGDRHNAQEHDEGSGVHSAPRSLISARTLSVEVVELLRLRLVHVRDDKGESEHGVAAQVRKADPAEHDGVQRGRKRGQDHYDEEHCQHGDRGGEGESALSLGSNRAVGPT